jgi:predicted ATP-binding protein involved in virulence
LRYIRRGDADQQKVKRELQKPFRMSLAFESTVQNEALQSWLVDLYTRIAIAKEKSQAFESYAASLRSFETALKLTCGEDIGFDVAVEPDLEPRIWIGGRSLNFSQLPDGIRNTVGWLADFIRRQQTTVWAPTLNGKRPGVLLIDEIDAHLHPRWQRTILPALREAFPEVQIIVSTHSPFVISSCPGARVHVFELDESGVAKARPPEDAPIGESIIATIKDIFGVNSRFDVYTQRELERWNELRRAQASGGLTPETGRELETLTQTLAAKSEELRSLVGAAQRLPQGLLESVLRG